MTAAGSALSGTKNKTFKSCTRHSKITSKTRQCTCSVAAQGLIKQIDNTPPAEAETIQKLRKAVRRRIRKDKDSICVIRPSEQPRQGVLQSNG